MIEDDDNIMAKTDLVEDCVRRRGPISARDVWQGVDELHDYTQACAILNSLRKQGRVLLVGEDSQGRNLYGTPRQPVEQHLEAGQPVLLEIELEGARQVRRSFPAGFQLLIKPPSLEELERRIRGRGTDAEAAILRRLERARAELAAEAEFDAILVNDELEQALAELEGALCVNISAQVEAELIELPQEERAEFLAGLGVSEGGLRSLIRATYQLLGLRTYFTTGEKETRAWTIRAGMTAPQAAGVIHTDFERGFIRAQTIGWQQLLEAGTLAEARNRGWLRSEGKDYVVAEGDVMEFLFNV
jgi:guanylate kinase